MVGFDTNETFDFDTDDMGGVALTAKSARGEATHGLTVLEQEAAMATYYPYNTSQRPRRLDYIWTRGIPISESEVKVVEKSRVLLGSDHDAVRLNSTAGASSIVVRTIQTTRNSSPSRLIQLPLLRLLILLLRSSPPWWGLRLEEGPRAPTS